MTFEHILERLDAVAAIKKSIVGHAKDQCEKHHFGANAAQWQYAELCIGDTVDELLREDIKQLEETRDNYDAIQRGREVDFEISARKSGDYL